MDDNVFQTIQNKLPGFSKGKQQIATYILTAPNEAAFQTAAMIGKAVKISESTVVRFAVDLGYKGFPEFQKALQEEVKSQLLKGATPCTTAPTSPNDTYDTVVEEFAAYLCGHDRLFVLSDAVGQVLLPYCEYAGKMVIHTVVSLSCYSKELLFSELSRLIPGDPILVLCFGETSPLLRFALKQCRSMGTKIFLLTDQPSEFYENTDKIIKITHCEREGVPDLSRGMHLLHRVFALVQERNGCKFHDQKNLIEKEWSKYEECESKIF